jgi:hypothetical protein
MCLTEILIQLIITDSVASHKTRVPVAGLLQQLRSSITETGKVYD